MSTHDRKEGPTLTIVDAVETLSNIADLEFDHNIGLEQQQRVFVEGKPLTHHTIHWLHEQDKDTTITVVKETFRVILNYLRNFYKNEYSAVYDPRAIENIKTIMVLVGEAAKKLDKYTELFHAKQGKSVTELKEYKKLQDFYHSRIARRIDEGVLGKWILGLTKKVQAERAPQIPLKLQGKDRQVKHVFIDLDSVKKDTEYELFLLRKDDGTRFFSPRLIRNIKLVSDFGDYFTEEKFDDPLVNIAIWQDRVAYACAKHLIKVAYVQIDKFFSYLKAYKESELAKDLNKSLMALMLAANPHNLSHNLPIKNCNDYLHDFKLFLRHCVHSREYERMIAYPPDNSNAHLYALMDTVQTLCQVIYTDMDGLQEIASWIHGLIQEAEKDEPAENYKNARITLWEQLNRDYVAMTKLMKLHPHGPLNKILEALESGNYREFDPFFQGNFPSQLFTLYYQDCKCSFARWPSPTHQEFIHKATVTDEFKAFLHKCARESGGNKCLILNFQDRLSWKDHFRSQAIEDLFNNKFLSSHVDIATIAKDTEFYQQLAPYHLENNADIFMSQFKAQVLDEHCGFLYAKEWKKILKENFIDKCMQAVHRIFFSGKNVLLLEHRLDFIEIFYQFLMLKIIELVKPDFVGFTCKDSIDTGASAGALFFVFLKFINQERLSDADRESLDLMLYGPALLYRERVLLQDRFNRMVSAIKVIEAVRDQLGQDNFVKVIREAFGPLYKMPMLEGKVLPHHRPQKKTIST